MIDLHMHTYYSDGRFSPQEVIDAALRLGLRVIAITDHDNARGAREAAQYLTGLGQERLELMSGIECTTGWPGVGLPPEDANVDVLGYGVDLDNPALQAFEQAALDDLHDRFGWCCSNLTERGYPITMADLFAENPRYAGGMQLIQALLRKGYAGSWDDAVKLMESTWFAARETPFTIGAVIGMIHRAGGAAVLAHPSIVRPKRKRLRIEHLAQLKNWGLDGVEVYHYRLDEDARAHFLGMAKELGLLVTGGTDMHGWYHGFDGLGSQPVTAEMVEALKDRVEKWKKNSR